MLGCVDNNVQDYSTANTPLPDFIIGTWKSARQEIYNGQVESVYYEVSFIDKNTLRFIKKSASDGFDDRFEYKFINNNKISVENQRTKNGYWILSQDNDALQICLWADSNCLHFTKKP
jgi:hypothetical protein